MAGEARTNKFMLGTATVMIGPQAKLFELDVATHSIGLVKNFTMTSEPQYSELTQGVKNTIVFSTMTQNPVRASMEAYEFTSRNLAYGLGLDGSTLAPLSVASTLASEITGTSGTPVTSVPLAAGGGATFAANDWIMLQEGTGDRVFITRIASKATDTLTVAPGLPVTIAAGSAVKKVNVVSVGSKENQPFLAAKVVGTLADGTAVTVLIPKVRITKGFSLAFTTQDYGNLPFEFTVYDPVSTDPFYTEFSAESAKIFSAG